jgi:hypothetical protein
MTFRCHNFGEATRRDQCRLSIVPYLWNCPAVAALSGTRDLRIVEAHKLAEALVKKPGGGTGTLASWFCGTTG